MTRREYCEELDLGCLATAVYDWLRRSDRHSENMETSEQLETGDGAAMCWQTAASGPAVSRLSANRASPTYMLGPTRPTSQMKTLIDDVASENTAQRAWIDSQGEDYRSERWQALFQPDQAAASDGNVVVGRAGIGRWRYCELGDLRESYC